MRLLSWGVCCLDGWSWIFHLEDQGCDCDDDIEADREPDGASLAEQAHEQEGGGKASYAGAERVNGIEQTD